MKKVVLIGDSIRLHYQPLVTRALATEAVVLGPMENCGTSTDILAQINEWIFDYCPDIVHLNCGLHDLRIDAGVSTHQVPIDKYAANLDEIFALIGKGGRRTLIWATLTPVNEQWHQDSRPSRRYESDVALYNKTALDRAHKHGARINDLHRAVTAAGSDRLLGPDGVHFTEEGYVFLAAAVVSAVRGCLRGSPPEW
jgi:lysophospholipase L1-like esterase